MITVLNKSCLILIQSQKNMNQKQKQKYFGKTIEGHLLTKII